MISLGVPPQEFVGFTADGSGYFADERSNHCGLASGQRGRVGR